MTFDVKKAKAINNIVLEHGVSRKVAEHIAEMGDIIKGYKDSSHLAEVSANGSGFFGNLMHQLTQSQDFFPAKEIVGGAAIGVAGGVLHDKMKEKDISTTQELKDNIKLHRSAIAANKDEDAAIDAILDKYSSQVPDMLAYGASAVIPAILVNDHLKNNKKKDEYSRKLSEIKELRDQLDANYRADMLEQMGMTEEDLQYNLSELTKTGNESKVLSSGAVTALAASTGLLGFLTAHEFANKNSSRRSKRKEYLKTIEAINRNKAQGVTVNKLPFSDEELLAMEVFRQKGRKKPVIQEIPDEAEPAIPEAGETATDINVVGDATEVDLNSDDLGDILNEL